MTNENKKIITRFAPSPTGPIHIGGLRTALFNYLYAKKNDGKFIIRIDDTDKERSKKEYEEDILKGIRFLKIKEDIFVRQSENISNYKKAIKYLVDNGNAYISDKEEGSPIRFKSSKSKVSFNDLIRGDIEIESGDTDFVIAKDFNTPLYHIANVVDDERLGITHIIRGEDHITNTARQILLIDALGYKNKEYAHIPLIHSIEGSKLSKRNKETSFESIMEEYLSGAVLNFIVFLGWSPKDDREIFSLEELIDEFSIKRIQKSSAKLNIEKLKWYNKEYIKALSNDDFYELVYSRVPEKIKKAKTFDERKILLLSKEIGSRVSILSDIDRDFNDGVYDYIFSTPNIDRNVIDKKCKGVELKDIKRHMKKVLDLLNDIPEEKWLYDSIKSNIFGYATDEGRSLVLWPFRYILSGKESSIDPFTISEIVGKKETYKRVNNFINE